MAGIFQRQGAALSISITTTITLSTSTTMQLGTLTSCEIANLSTTASAAFVFTPIGALTATSAALGTDRVIPPDTVLYEWLPLGASFVSAVASTGTPVIQFTPGSIKDLA